MSRADLSSLNAGYVAEMLESYLDAPGSVPAEWRELFENDPGAVAGALPGLSGLLRQDVNGDARVVGIPELPQATPESGTARKHSVV
ncbi:MAG: hypothetical protein LH654_15015 [Thermoleophilia bacterium]|nr:hypothetical protein [Thermoleophilia bacterium]